jgi:hypothetical protein
MAIRHGDTIADEGTWVWSTDDSCKLPRLRNQKAAETGRQGSFLDSPSSGLESKGPLPSPVRRAWWARWTFGPTEREHEGRTMTRSWHICPVRPRRVAPAVLAAFLAGGVLAGCGTGANPRSHATVTTGPQATKHGLVGYASYLPKSTLNFYSDATVMGTIAKPALTSQGDLVKVVMPRWSVLIVISGPEVPGEGLPYQAVATTCTWTVSMTNEIGRVPISVADFDSIDFRGNVFHPTLVTGQPVPPDVLEPGQKVTFELRTGEPVGEGLMRWAPSGTQIVAKWDFVVEDD